MTITNAKNYLRQKGYTFVESEEHDIYFTKYEYNYLCQIDYLDGKFVGFSVYCEEDFKSQKDIDTLQIVYNRLKETYKELTDEVIPS